MQWREPNAYNKKGLSHGRCIGLLIVLMIPTLLLLISAANHDFSKGRIILALLFLALGLFGFARVWLGSGDFVCLKEDHITDGSGRSVDRSRYRDIECCSVSRDRYKDTKFSILRFTTKKGLPAGQVKEVAVPDDVNLEKILQILRDKGVKVIEAP